MITQSYLKSILDYNPDTGVFTWRVNRGNVKAGNVAGNYKNNGYIRIKINNKEHKAHRLVWLYVHGEFPTEQIDHINHIRTDNRIANLRCVSRQENMKNASKRNDNTSGIVGVYWDKQYNKWRAQIMANGKNIKLGSFINIDDAIASRKQAEIDYGYHPNHGKNKSCS